MLAGAGLAGPPSSAPSCSSARPGRLIPPLPYRRSCSLVVVPGRTRRAWALVVAGAGIAACLAPVLDVYDSVRGGRPPADSELREAALAILLASAAVGAIWAGAVAIVARLGKRAVAARRRARGCRWLVGVTVVAAVGWRRPSMTRSNACGTSTGRSSSSSPDGDVSSRFTTGGGNRYDYWRVAWNQFEDEPLRGIGAGNYDRTYFIERQTPEDIRQPHSIELQTLGELGVVGGVLLAAFLVAILAGFVRRAQSRPRRSPVAAAGGGGRGDVRGLARPHQRRLAASDSRG